MTDIVKNIENTEQVPNNFDIEIEKSFQKFLNYNEFKYDSTDKVYRRLPGGAGFCYHSLGAGQDYRTVAGHG